MKAVEQVKTVIRGADNSSHSFFTMLATALQKKIQADTGMEVSFVGKVTSGHGEMKAVLTGEFHDPDQKKVEEAGRKIQKMMDEIKNPSALVSLIK
jgi:hypothetical protein